MHFLTAFSDGRESVPLAVAQRSKLLKDLISEPSSERLAIQELPRTLFQAWAQHAQQQADALNLENQPAEQLVNIIKVQFNRRIGSARY